MLKNSKRNTVSAYTILWQLWQRRRQKGSMYAELESVRLIAIKDVLDRNGFKPTDKVEIRLNIVGR
jgi:hypothetical protein